MINKYSILATLLTGCVLMTLTCKAEQPIVIAHRGGDYFAPENTLICFAASSNKSDMVEFDVYVSLDGELVVIHDATVDRTTDGTGNVNAKTLAELKLLDAGSWYSSAFADERIPTLSEALNAILPSRIPLIERKAGTAQEYVDELQALNMTTNVVLQSFDWNFLGDVNTLDGDIKLAALGSGILTTDILTNLQSKGVGTVAWALGNVTTTEVDMVHSKGMELYVWTVNGPVIQDFLAMGIDGIITDDPGLASDLADDSSSGNEQMVSELVSYWRFDDGLTNIYSTLAYDIEDRNPGALGGFGVLPGWTNGVAPRFGGSLHLDGISGFVSIPNSESLNIDTNSLSISLWVNLPKKPSQQSESYGGIYDSVGDSYVLYLDKNSAELRFKLTDANGSAARPGIPEANLKTGEWHHVAAVFNGSAGPVSGQAVIYLDGQLMDVHTGSDSSGNIGLDRNVKPGQEAAIGRNGTQSSFWLSCTVDDVAIWRRQLSYGEILQIYNGRTRGSPLQKQIIQFAITGFVPGLDSVNTRCAVSHGSIATNDIVLMSENAVEGEYIQGTNVYIEQMSEDIFELLTPADASDSKFFKIQYP